MKSKIILVILFSIIVSQNAIASESAVNTKNMEISFSPMTRLSGSHHHSIRGLLAFPGAALNYRWGLSEKIALGISMFGRWLPELPWDIGGGLSAKFFLTGKVFQDGWYIEPGIAASFSPFGRERVAHTKDEWITLLRWSLTPSLLAGYTWVWDSGFSINFGLGIGYGFHFAKTEFLADNGTHTAFLGDLSFGWVW